MKFNVVALVFTMAAIAVAQSYVTGHTHLTDAHVLIICSRTVYVTVPCSPSTVAPSGVASPTTVASTAVKSTPIPTGSPISYATGAASANAVSGSALGMIIVGGVALVRSSTLNCIGSR